ncbi:MAG: hypothetical protein ACRC6X_02365 [Culicoidibacterales bacterium]
MKRNPKKEMFDEYLKNKYNKKYLETHNIHHHNVVATIESIYRKSRRKEYENIKI